MVATAKQKYTPPEIAKLWGGSPDKVVGWIRSGELRAIDASSKRGKRPRYLVDLTDLEDFERSRQVIADPKPTPRRRKQTDGVIEFFK